MSQAAATPWPVEIRAKRAERVLEIDFDTGERFSLPAEMLRVLSPSAEVQGHSAGEAVTVPGKRHVGFAEVAAVGNYAVRITFDDGHDTGFYSWAYLHELGTSQDHLWTDYLSRLEAQGLSRDP